MEIKEAITEDEIRECFPVLKTLRLHFTDVSEFLPRVLKQQQDGYHLVYVRDEGEIHAIAGYRIREHLEISEPRYAIQTASWFRQPWSCEPTTDERRCFQVTSCKLVC